MTASTERPVSAAPDLGGGVKSDAHHSLVPDVGAAASADTTGPAIVMVANDATVRSFNPAAELLLDRKAIDVVGHAVTALELDEHRGELAITFERVSAGEDAARRETSSGREKELTRAQLEHEQRELASDRERIGRDLHDLVIQRLFATGLALQGVANLVALPEAARRISAAVDELDTVIRDIRTTIFALGHHHASSSPSLRGHILEVISEAAEGLGHNPTIRLDGPVDTAVSDEIGDHLLAVLREALSNVTRHAHATSTSILVRVDGNIILRVTDDGTGTSNVTRTSGLRNMRQRAEVLGGTMAMTGLPTGGTSVEWQVPLAF